LGPIPNPQSPIPNPQQLFKKENLNLKKHYFYIDNVCNKKNKI